MKQGIKRKRGRPPSTNPKKTKKEKKDNTLTERYEQRIVVAYAEKHGYPFFAVNNGARRSLWEAMEAKRNGMKAGVLDLFCLVPMHGYNGLAIEMKRKEGGIVSPIQEYWIALLRENGFRVLVAHGADQAIPIIDEYFKGWKGTSSDTLALLQIANEHKALYRKRMAGVSGVQGPVPDVQLGSRESDEEA